MAALPSSPDTLIRYNEWANTRWLDSLRVRPDLSAHTQDLFTHLLAVEDAWVRRLRGQAVSNFEWWPSLTWEECATLVARNADAYQTFIDTHEEAALDAPLSYTDASGSDRTILVRDALTHVVTHSHYHRGQVAQSVRAQGFDPVNTDLTAFIQQRST